MERGGSSEPGEAASGIAKRPGEGVRAAGWAGAGAALPLSSQRIAKSGSRCSAASCKFAMSLGRALQLALLCEHAQWSLQENDGTGVAAAVRFGATPLVTLRELNIEESKSLSA